MVRAVHSFLYSLFILNFYLFAWFGQQLPHVTWQSTSYDILQGTGRPCLDPQSREGTEAGISYLQEDNISRELKTGVWKQTGAFNCSLEHNMQKPTLWLRLSPLYFPRQLHAEHDFRYSARYQHQVSFLNLRFLSVLLGQVLRIPLQWTGSHQLGSTHLQDVRNPPKNQRKRTWPLFLPAFPVIATLLWMTT